MWHAVMMLVDMRVFLFSTCLTTLIKYMRVGGRRHRGQQGQVRGEDQGGHRARRGQLGGEDQGGR